MSGYKFFCIIIGNLYLERLHETFISMLGTNYNENPNIIDCRFPIEPFGNDKAD